MEKVVEFVSTRRDERSMLREAIQNFGASVSACESPSHARDIFEDCQAKLQRAKIDFQKSMGFYTEEQGNSLLTVGLPIGLAIYATLGGADPFTLLNISNSVCIGAVAAYSDFNRVKKQARKQSYASYLVEIDGELGGTGNAPHAHRILEEFIND
jgi:hypothetical protein